MGRPRLSDPDKLHRALTELHQVLGSERGVVRGPELNNATRVLLLKKGFLREILKGWYFVSDPTAEAGDTTPFFANFWEYLSKYLQERFGTKYCLTAEQSLLRHAQHNVVPQQVNVMLGVDQSQIQQLTYGRSLALYPGKRSFPSVGNVCMLDGLRCMTPPFTLVMLTPKAFQANARDVQVVLSTVTDPAAIAELVHINASGVARVVAAMRQIGRDDFADDVLKQLAGLDIPLLAVSNPFEGQVVHHLGAIPKAPLYARIQALWAEHRPLVLAARPDPLPPDATVDTYLRQVDAIRVADAYHSLSIERYRVTPELIQKIADGAWTPDTEPTDKQHIEALAAKGYLDAFALIREDASKVFQERQPGTLAAKVFADRHQAWFQKLFGTSVDAGILELRELMGYRRHMVFLRGSQHSPPHFDYVRDGMEALKDCFAAEPDAFVRAVLGHWLFGFIHPYMDGNGRMARFLMNLMLASGRYPWTIIRVDDRVEYMACLEQASVEGKIKPFADFLSALVRQTTEVSTR